MGKKDLETKEKIIESAIQLIKEHGDVAKITTRDIASRANAGIGLVNYHFQTKENLINQCVQKIIGNVIAGFGVLEESLDLEPYERLKYLIKLNAEFLVENEGVSKVSITGDLLSGNPKDNSIQTMMAYFGLLKKIYGERKSDEELRVILHILISTVQVAFLRHDVLKETEGIDFFIKEQRDHYMDLIIDRVFYDLF